MAKVVEVIKVRKFEDLVVWQRARRLSLDIYSASRQFPREEMYGMTSQIRRASVSIASNIAEGSKRATTNDLCHFLTMAQGSSEEVKSLLMISCDLNYMTAEKYQNLRAQTDIIGALLHNLAVSLKS